MYLKGENEGKEEGELGIVGLIDGKIVDNMDVGENDGDNVMLLMVW
jgi:hypothetical protein